MSTSNQKRRGPLALLRDGAAPALASLAIFAAGCGGGSGAGDPETPGPGTETPPPALSAPAIALVDPQVGPPAGGTVLTISGSGFLEGVQGPVVVRIGGKPAGDVQVVDDLTITCTSPVGAPDASVSIEVENSRGQAVLANAFSYLGLPGVNTDLDGDGLADMVISAQFDSSTGLYAGSVYIFYGSDSDPILDMNATSADVKIMGAAPGDRFGCSVASGDLNGDGQDDLVIGASHVDGPTENTGAAYVFFGPLPNSADLSALQADAILTGVGLVKDDFFGASLGVGHVDGDSDEELLVGAPGVDLNPGGPDSLPDVGAVYLFHGSAEFTDGQAADAVVVVLGDEARDELGNACSIADLDGDGLGDLVVGAYRANPVVPPKKYDAGAVYVFLAGQGLANGRASDADAMFSGEEPGDAFGSSVADGDANGDEIADLMVGAPGSQALGSETGRAYVFLGTSGLVGRSAALADAIYSGQQSNADFGRDLTASDFNGDGYADLAIGAPHNSFGANKNGRCYVFLGGEELQDGLAHFADVIFTGETFNGDRFGSSLEVIDLDGDGLADVMSAAVGNSGGVGLGCGRVYLFEGLQVLEDESANDDDLTLTGEAAQANFGSSISRGM